MSGPDWGTNQLCPSDSLLETKGSGRARTRGVPTFRSPAGHRGHLGGFFHLSELKTASWGPAKTGPIAPLQATNPNCPKYIRPREE